MKLKQNIIIAMLIGVFLPLIINTPPTSDEEQDIRSIVSQKLLLLVNNARMHGYTCESKYFSPAKPIKLSKVWLYTIDN